MPRHEPAGSEDAARHQQRLIERDGADWPHREHSRTLAAGGVAWHVLDFGPAPGAAESPPILLLHGTGASGHSFAGLAPLLAAQGRVLVPDLPGHGFSVGGDLSLEGMSDALAALLRRLEVDPAVVLGHSAGGAIGVRLCLLGLASPQHLIGVNAALLPFRGLAGLMFAPTARCLARSRRIPKLFAARAARPEVMARLIAHTGSTLDAAGIERYRRLMALPEHAASALEMMARWDLAALERRLPALATPLHLLVGSNDQTLSPQEAWRVRERLPTTRIEVLPGLGHLAHEEAPERVAEHVLRVLRDTSPGPAAGC